MNEPRLCVCVRTHMFVYMYFELGGGGGEYKNSVLMWLMCLMFAVQLCEPYVTRFVWERLLGVRKGWVLILIDTIVQAHAILYAVLPC